MSCQAADQVERTVEMRSCGGSDGPHRSLVMVFMRLVFEFWLSDILGVELHSLV